ncbi:DNRLRE domain-containing protein [Streptomyces fructofermentans]|uniref:DNRLRE domain-containing protein n=1 Tax=Streptomyces fructofermentans TaxID=152141 RepID=UPI0037B14497
MPTMQFRMPGRRTLAFALATAVAATGIGYAGYTRSDGQQDTEPHRAKTVNERTAFAEAARTGRQVEVTSEHTESSTTWARPDGQLATRFHASPVRVRKDGEWHAIDTDLRRSKAGWETTATHTRMVFTAGSGAQDPNRASRDGIQRVSLVKNAPSAATGSELVTLYVGDAGEYAIQLTWPGPVPAPIIDGSRALYPEIFPGADLVLTADNDGFAQLLVLKNRAAAANPMAQQLSYGITSEDLTFRLDPLSGVLTAETFYGNDVASSGTPLMWDSTGQPAITDGQVGATAQPTGSESPEPTGSQSWSPEPVPAEEATNDAESDEQTDRESEAPGLPTPTDGPEVTPSPTTTPQAPAEPTPGPSHGGSAATLSLPLLDGPAPDSLGNTVESDLSDDNWVVTPDLDFLNAPETTYPVFVDPSITKDMDNWTTAYSRHPNATFYNGKGFNKAGTHEARVGFESDTWGTSRSFFNMDFDKNLKGAKISSAKLRLLETYAWSCSSRSMSVHVTGAIGKKTNWKNAPKLTDGNKLQTRSFAHGYKSGCRDAYETFDVKKAAQNYADLGRSKITFGMRARDEKSQHSWKKFQANGENGPALELVYNRRPSAPTNLDLAPDAKCTTTEPYVRMGAGSVTFTARGKDKDGNLDYLDFDLWPTGKWATTGDVLGSTGKVPASGDDALGHTTAFPTSRLTDATLYSWRVRGVDDKGATSGYSPAKTPCRFVLDTTAPKRPTVTSTDFPDADGSENGFGNDAEDANWSQLKFGTGGSFTVYAGSTDTIRFEYSFNGSNYNFSKSRTAGTPVTTPTTIADAKPPTAGPNVLYIRAIDSAGNPSAPALYFFYVSPRDEADSAGDFTGDDLADLMVVTAEGNLSLYPSQATSDLARASGDLDYSMSGAYRANPAKDPGSEDGLPPFVAAPSGHFDDSLITHNGDIYGGDGLQDLVVRVDGKLWVYPGDGYGAVNIDKRREIILPAGAPSPASMDQIVAAGDITGDGRTDFFARAGTELWALIGYHGATISSATRLTATLWDERDIVTVGDVSGDGVADMIYRTDPHAALRLRKGIASASGSGVDLNSLTSGANSSGGADIEYSATGWSRASVPHIIGTPDVTGDPVPDLWTVRADGSVRLYAGGTGTLTGAGTEIITPRSYWKTRIAIG